MVRSRFRREALAAARLSGQPNTVTIFDVGEWRGTPFIVMEYLGGGTLEQKVKHGPQRPERALAWLEQAAHSLDAAHAHGVVHRDVKPANLLLDEAGHLHVGDFGIATAAGLDSLTLTGTMLGTVGYLAPEQAQGLTASAASDGYALAVVAYELLTGTRPFARESATAEAAAHIYEAVPSAVRANDALPTSVDPIFTRALAKDPRSRFPTCTAFVAILRSAFESRDETATLPITAVARSERPTTIVQRRPRRSRLLIGSAVLLFLAGIVLAGTLLAHTGGPAVNRGAPTTAHTLTLTTTVVAPPSPGAAPAKSAPPSRPSAASDLNTQGYRLMLASNYAAALPLLRRAVAGLLDPANPVTAYANFNLGQTLVKLGECAAAIPYLRRAQRLEPSRHEVRDAISYATQCARPTPPTNGEPPSHAHHNHGNGNRQSNANEND